MWLGAWRLQDRIVCDAADFVVLDKPAQVQVAPTVDNVLENCLTWTAQVRARVRHSSCTSLRERTTHQS